MVTTKTDAITGFGSVEFFSGPDLIELLDRKPHLAGIIKRLIDAPPPCPACTNAIEDHLPALFARVVLPGGLVIWAGICGECIPKGADLPNAIAAGLARNGIADMRVLDRAHLHATGGRA